MKSYFWFVLLAIIVPIHAHAWGSKSYQLPDGAFEGYWAMKGLIGNESVVIDFRQDKGMIVSNNYRFDCSSANALQSFGQSTMMLTPTKKAMQVQVANHAPFSTIAVKKFTPKQTLILEQEFLDKELKKATPDEGLIFEYVYTPTLRPLCP